MSGDTDGGRVLMVSTDLLFNCSKLQPVGGEVGVALPRLPLFAARSHQERRKTLRLRRGLCSGVKVTFLFFRRQQVVDMRMTSVLIQPGSRQYSAGTSPGLLSDPTSICFAFSLNLFLNCCVEKECLFVPVYFVEISIKWRAFPQKGHFGTWNVELSFQENAPGIQIWRVARMRVWFGG